MKRKPKASHFTVVSADRALSARVLEGLQMDGCTVQQQRGGLPVRIEINGGTRLDIWRALAPYVLTLQVPRPSCVVLRVSSAASAKEVFAGWLLGYGGGGFVDAELDAVVARVARFVARGRALA